MGDILPPKPTAPLPFEQGGNTDDAMMAAVQESVRQRARVVPTGQTAPPPQAIEHPPFASNNTLDVANEIAARRPRPNTPSVDQRPQPLPLTATAFVGRVAGSGTITGAAATGHSASIVASADVVPAPIQITPTVYPDDPSAGSVTVINHITINVNNVNFRELQSTIGDVISLMKESNAIAGETRDQLIAELRAGFEILRAPKANPKLIDLLLVGPLKYLADKAASPAIATAALAALAALGKLTGWW